jgi:hypothetical protein
VMSIDEPAATGIMWAIAADLLVDIDLDAA